MAFTCYLSNIFNNSYPLSGFIALSLVVVSNSCFSDPYSPDWDSHSHCICRWLDLMWAKPNQAEVTCFSVGSCEWQPGGEIFLPWFCWFLRGRRCVIRCIFRSLFKKIYFITDFQTKTVALLQIFLSSAPNILFGIVSITFFRKPSSFKNFQDNWDGCLYLAWLFLDWTMWNSITAGHKWSDIGSFTVSLHIWGTLNIYSSEDFRAEGSHQDNIVQLPAVTDDCPWAGPGLPSQ